MLPRLLAYGAASAPIERGQARSADRGLVEFGLADDPLVSVNIRPDPVLSHAMLGRHGAHDDERPLGRELVAPGRDNYGLADLELVWCLGSALHGLTGRSWRRGAPTNEIGIFFRLELRGPFLRRGLRGQPCGTQRPRPFHLLLARIVPARLPFGQKDGKPK